MRTDTVESRTWHNTEPAPNPNSKHLLYRYTNNKRYSAGPVWFPGLLEFTFTTILKKETLNNNNRTEKKLYFQWHIQI